jgi:hypothetical protein
VTTLNGWIQQHKAEGINFAAPAALMAATLAN